MGLGAVHTISLAQARESAAKCRALLHEGLDPIEAKRAKRAQNALAQHSGTTFADCAARLISSHESSWRNAKHRAQWVSTLSTYAFPVLGSLPVAAIDTALVLKVLEPIWTTKPETASRLRGRIEAVIDWAKARGIRDGENPARWKGHLDHLLPAKSKVRKVKHHAALPYGDVGKFLEELRKREGLRARALEFVVLTASRTGEVLGMRWGEVDPAAKVWTVPEIRMKGGREHRVPLSAPAIAVLQACGPRRRPMTISYSPGLKAARCPTGRWRWSTAGWDTTSQVTAFGRPFGTGPPSAPATRTTLSRWHSPTRSATRSRPRIGAAIYSRSAAGSWMSGDVSAQRRGTAARSCPSARR